MRAGVRPGVAGAAGGSLAVAVQRLSAAADQGDADAGGLKAQGALSLINGYRVRKDLREMAIFAVQNVIKDPPFTKLDLISCRNLLIYFDDVSRRAAAEAMYDALSPGGFICLGHSESGCPLGSGCQWQCRVAHIQVQVATASGTGSAFNLKFVCVTVCHGSVPVIRHLGPTGTSSCRVTVLVVLLVLVLIKSRILMNELNED